MDGIEELVFRLGSVDDDGLIREATLEEYAGALGVGIEEADQLMDEAMGRLVSDGTVTKDGWDYYLTEVMEEREREREEEEEMARQEEIDARQAYDYNVWN